MSGINPQLPKSNPSVRYHINQQNLRNFAEDLGTIDWVSVTSASRDKPWINIILKDMIREKKKLYHKYKRNPNESNTTTYKCYQNWLYNPIKSAKKQCAASLLANYDNSKDQWNVINNLIRPGCSKGTMIDEIHLNDTELADPYDMANAFNSFHFISVSSLLVSFFKWQVHNRLR